MKQTLTLEIVITKKSVINKFQRAFPYFQQFKNLLYLCLWEYYLHTRDLKPFKSVNFLEKFVKGKEYLPLKMKGLKSGKKSLKLYGKSI